MKVKNNGRRKKNKIRTQPKKKNEKQQPSHTSAKQTGKNKGGERSEGFLGCLYPWMHFMRGRRKRVCVWMREKKGGGGGSKNRRANDD